MSKYAVMPLSDYVDACNFIREKTGTSDAIKSSELTEQINNVFEVGKAQGGGGDSYYDAFWDGFQQNGARQDYTDAFKGWKNAHNYWKPKYDMNMTGGSKVFYSFKSDVGLPELCERAGIALDWSKVATFQQTFSYATIPDVGVIDTRGANGLSSIFLYAYVKKAEIIMKDDGSQTSLSGSFTGATSLTDLIIRGKIGDTVDFKDSKNLTKDSINSIVCALSPEATGKKITFSKAVEEAVGFYPAAFKWTNYDWMVYNGDNSKVTVEDNKIICNTSAVINIWTNYITLGFTATVPIDYDGIIIVSGKELVFTDDGNGVTKSCKVPGFYTDLGVALDVSEPVEITFSDMLVFGSTYKLNNENVVIEEGNGIVTASTDDWNSSNIYIKPSTEADYVVAKIKCKGKIMSFANISFMAPTTQEYKYSMSVNGETVIDSETNLYNTSQFTNPTFMTEDIEIKVYNRDINILFSIITEYDSMDALVGFKPNWTYVFI